MYCSPKTTRRWPTSSRGAAAEALSVDIARDGATALERARTVEYDVIVLDRDLPVMHGDVVCEALTSAGALTRILMLTASAAIDERVEGLALGADDYLPKPFAMSELVARIRALGRREMRARPSVLVPATSGSTRPGGARAAARRSCGSRTASSRCSNSCSPTRARR